MVDNLNIPVHQHCWLADPHSPTRMVMKQATYLAQSDSLLESFVAARALCLLAVAVGSVESVGHLLFASSLILTTGIRIVVISTASALSWVVWIVNWYFLRLTFGVGYVHWLFRVVSEIWLFTSAPKNYCYQLLQRVHGVMQANAWSRWLCEQAKVLHKTYSDFHTCDHAVQHLWKSVALAVGSVSMLFLILPSAQEACAQFDQILGPEETIPVVHIPKKHHWGKIALLIGLVGLIAFDYKQCKFTSPADYAKDLLVKGSTGAGWVLGEASAVGRCFFSWCFPEKPDWTEINRAARNINAHYDANLNDMFQRLKALEQKATLTS